MPRSIAAAALALWLTTSSCGTTEILRNPATVPTTETRRVGDVVCWVEPAWMRPGTTECGGYRDPAPGVPSCPSTKTELDPRPSRTEWTTKYEYDEAQTAIARRREPLACCYRCNDELYDLGQ